MRKTLSIILLCLGSLAVALPVKAQSGDIYDMIAQVNAVRSSNGLSLLEVDGSLMASAQVHAEYMASTGVCSHTGAGGTTAKQRMINAGYGGGGKLARIAHLNAGQVDALF